MKHIIKIVGPFTVYLATLSSSFGAINLQLTEVGTDVVGIYSGSIDVSSLTPFTTGLTVSTFFTNTLHPSIGFTEVSLTDASLSDIYFLSAVNFGAGFGLQTITSSSGGFAVRDNFLAVPEGYAGGSIDATITLMGASFASMGITSGDSGLISDLGGVAGDVTWSAVPEPTSSGLLIGLATLCFRMSLRRRRV